MAAWRPGWNRLVLLLVALALFAAAPAPAEALTPTVTRTPTPTRTPTATPTPPAAWGPSQSILGRRFLPRTMRVVGVGATVRWTNSDRVGHTVTSSTGLFDSGVLATRSAPRTGGVFAYRFTAPGKYSYYCAIHRGMIGTVQVVPPAPPTPVRARPGSVR